MHFFMLLEIDLRFKRFNLDKSDDRPILKKYYKKLCMRLSGLNMHNGLHKMHFYATKSLKIIY